MENVTRRDTADGDLAGRRVLVTREAERCVETARRIEARGGIPVLFPTIETVPPEDAAPLRQAARDLECYDWVVMPSRTAVRALARTCEEMDLSLARRGRPRFAAVGQGSAAALTEHGVLEVLTPDASREDAEGLASVLVRLGVGGARVLLPRAEKGREVLAARLREAGAMVTEVVAYRTLPRDIPEREVGALLAGPRPDAVLFFSPSAFHAFVRALGDERARAFLSGPVLCAIGPTTARAMTEAGLTPQAVAARPSVDEALDAVVRVGGWQ